MSHEWDRGVLTEASWHGLENIGAMVSAKDIINHGEESGAWPINIRHDSLVTATEGLMCPLKGIVADYKKHASRCLSAVGGRFNATSPAKWRELISAAVKAGAKPTGAFSLRKGSRVLATFEVGESNGLKSNLVLADCFDGTIKLTAGFTSIRVVCANTLSAAMSKDGDGMARLGHTSSLDEKITVLGDQIAKAIQTGQAVKELYEQAEQTHLHKDEAEALLEMLFPTPPEEASQQAKTRAKNKRLEALRAAQLPVNRVGNEPGNVATLWNAATFIVDRKVDADGKASFRKLHKGSDRLDSMLFGTRGKHIAQIEQVMIQVLRPDGSEVSMAVDQAIDAGVDKGQLGSALIDSILDDN